ncbi:MAG: hypothetical protein ACKO5K_04295 [Armatimonadota bacterium]
MSVDVNQFVGVWQLVRAFNDGIPTQEDIMSRFQFHVYPDHVKVVVEDLTVLMESESTIDGSTDPAHSTTHMPDGSVILGIIKMEQGQMVSCVAAPGAPRPTEFASPAGAGLSLRYFDRVRDL